MKHYRAYSRSLDQNPSRKPDRQISDVSSGDRQISTVLRTRNGGVRGGFQIFFLACVAAMCAIYGGIHLSALNFSFPSSTEKLLWRISCIVTVSQSLLAPAFVIWSMWTFQHGFVKAQRHIFNYRKEPSESWARYGFRVFIILGVVTLPLSITTRLFLVIESFISLRGVPAGVYATVPWTQYIPHI
jgi:hypothetical protein